MVRLVVIVSLILPARKNVSIPIWCDWWFAGFSCISPFHITFQFLYGAIGGMPSYHRKTLSYLFQFLYGAIGGINVSLNVSSICCFNSYMVRLVVMNR